MRFSVKLAPGIRLSASSRGLRAHVGPRSARLHVGGGQTGISTGAGPVSFYAPIGQHQASPRRPPSGPSREAEQGGSFSAGAGHLTAKLRSISKSEQAAAVTAVLQHLERLHRQNFPRVSEPEVPAPMLPAQEEILAKHLAEARSRISLFRRAKRREAEEAARWSAFREIDLRWRQAQAEYERRLASTRAWWQRLQACDADTVWEQLGLAFADNEAAAAPLSVQGTNVTLAVLLPPVSCIPDRLPGTTESGRTSLRRMTKTQAASWYAVLAAGYVLTTADEAFAVAPGIHTATLVALRPSEALIAPSAVECVVACTIDRTALALLDRAKSSPDALASVASPHLCNPDARTGAFRPVDLRDEPDLRAIVDSVDVEDLERRHL